jgi:hypothetical protein
MKLLCKIGLHVWMYHLTGMTRTKVYRRCMCCPRIEDLELQLFGYAWTRRKGEAR